VAGKLSRTPFNVLSIRLDPQWASRWNWLFYRLAVSWADVVLTNSYQAIRTLSSRGVTPGTAPRVIYNGIDIKTFDEAQSLSPPVTGNHDKNGSEKTICVVSNLRPPKSLETLLHAFAIVLQSVPEARLWVVGDGPTRTELEEKAMQLGVTNRVRFWGMSQHVPSLLREATIGVNSSRNEGLPNAVIEYMAARLPVVATKVGGTPELVTHGETGLLVSPQDSDGLTEALLVLLRNPELARQMGQAGRRRVEELFTVDRMVRQTEAVYEELLRRG
jgi:glycosyltransferase involved in cell wall biosynthesis